MKDLPYLKFPADKAMLIAAIGQEPDGLYEVSIKRLRPQRTLPQNRYYYGVVVPDFAAALSECWGEDVDRHWCHEWLSENFLPKRDRFNRITGELVASVRPSTAGLNVAEFCSYLDRIIGFARDRMAVTIRPAGEYEQPEPKAKERAA